MDKIKDKIPGTDQNASTYGTGTGYGTTGVGHQQHGGDNRGVMDKIKEKIPGTDQNQNAYGTGTGTGTGYGTTGYGASEGHHGDQQHHGEKKGIMDKIKEKLPGTGSCTGHGQGH